MKVKTYSQDREDLFIVENSTKLGIPELREIGTYIDVGAGDGVFLSNTYLFELIGWKGVCVEPDPTQHDKARRCRDEVLHRVVTQQRGLINFPCTDKHELSGMIEYPENNTHISLYIQ